MRVLILEDEPYMAEAIRDGLRLEAVAADIAGDGDTALELLKTYAYDIAVLDRDLPGPSGDEIARHIIASGTGIPILMLIDRLYAVNTRAIDLTEALLLLSRADQRSFSREPIDLSLVVEEATETLLPFAEEHGVTIETFTEMASAMGSETLLVQLTTNLVYNAIVHNRPDHGTVWITTSVHPKSVVLVVENTGEELTPRVVATLVEPFLRRTERTHANHAGAGLGLTIVQRITEAHDGTLTLIPRAAGGLCATVELPAAPPPIGEPEPLGGIAGRPGRG